MRRMPAEVLVVSLYDCNKEGLVRVVASDTHHKKTPPPMAGAPAARKKGSAGSARVHTSRVRVYRRKTEAPGSRTVPKHSSQKAAYPSGLRRCRCHTHTTWAAGTNPCPSFFCTTNRQPELLVPQDGNTEHDRDEV